MTTRAAGRTLQRNIESARPASSATLITYTTCRDATIGELPPEHVLSIRRFEAGGIATEIDWSFPGDQGLVWRNVVRTAQIGDRCAVEHRVELSSAEYLISPAGYSIRPPNIIRDLCQRDVLVGDMRVRAAVYPLREDGVDDFVALLQSEHRRLPILLLSPYANGEKSDLDAEGIARALAGVAIVTEADTPATTRALAAQLGLLGCYNGAARIYWPGFRRGDDIRRHPLMLGSRIGLLEPNRAANSLQRSIISVAAFRFAPDPRISAIISQSEANTRAERIQNAADEFTWEGLAISLAADLDQQKQELEALRAENENLRANQASLLAYVNQQDDDEETEVATSDVEPTTVLEAVELAIDSCQHLLFLDSARTSAEKSPFKRPQEIYDSLCLMNNVAHTWARNKGGEDLKTMLREAGLGKRVRSAISQTSRGKWGSDYTFRYEGEDRLFEWHVTLGSKSADTCASIHFLPDDTKGKLVIAHVGRHLTNTLT